MVMNTLENPAQRNNRQIAVWLLICCTLIFAMVVLGGVTRLTRSGLSMVEWDPIMGTIPPLSQGQWEETFEKYKQFPEYQKINEGMSLGEFKSIFWFEYGHRVLGRAIGLAFLLPLLYFMLAKKVTRSLVPKLVTMFILGGLQGLLGWYMVKSGLVDKPHVSQYRLTAHLAAAITIYGFIFWVALDLLLPKGGARDARTVAPLRRFGLLSTVSICLMIITGGFVAGTKAGFAFNTFPLMNGQWIPQGYMALDPWFSNFFDNIAAVQFNHRFGALLLCIIVLGYWFASRRFELVGRTRTVFHLLLAMLAIQMVLGIATLVYVVPVALGAAHQAGALVLFTIALMLNHELRARRALV